MTIEHGSIDFMFVAPPPPSCWIRYYSHTFFNVDLCLIHVIDTTSHDNITDAASFQNAIGTHPSLSQVVHLFHSQLLPFHEQLFHLLPYCINL